ncbi:Flp pilus assembly protein CpaB [Trinickia acidisoli]|uniref:Flp pilus assembly protein CpaB n=1 Tax=Trinickia acidisoli TaxID=2767482 RepID=UPI001A8E6646|nr:Flp pilus assembly protein CpaB [Trinickia acidisoli]
MSSTVKLALLVALAVVSAIVLRALFIAASAHPSMPSVQQRVRVAAADLPAGLLLRSSDLAWKELPPGQTVPAQAVRQNDPATPDVAGAVMLRPIAAGTPITAKDVVFPTAPGFLAAALKPDMRAVSVAIDDVSGNAGLIEPGDYVDLILTQNLSDKVQSPRMSVASETIVDHVRVLAVGSAFTRPKDDGSTDNAHARTVTLEVTPRMAEVVAISARLGTLSLALRSFATLVRSASGVHTDHDDTIDAPAPVWAGDVSRAVRALPNSPNADALSARVSNGTTVLVYRGSSHGDSEATAAQPSSPGAANAAPHVPPVRVDLPAGDGGSPPIAAQSAPINGSNP